MTPPPFGRPTPTPFPTFPPDTPTFAPTGGTATPPDPTGQPTGTPSASPTPSGTPTPLPTEQPTRTRTPDPWDCWEAELEYHDGNKRKTWNLHCRYAPQSRTDFAGPEDPGFGGPAETFCLYDTCYEFMPTCVSRPRPCDGAPPPDPCGFFDPFPYKKYGCYTRSGQIKWNEE
jgi:hypothetical protein